MAESSWRTRRTQWKHYYQFCEGLQVYPLPCSSHNLCLYIAFMARRFKYVSILNYVSAVRTLHKVYGVPPPPPDDFLVRSTLMGTRRLLGDTCFSSDPLLPKQLYRMYPLLNMTKTEDLVLWTAIVLSFRGLLRKSNVCMGQNALLRSDVSFFSWGVVLHLRRTKTIQYRERVHDVPIAEVGGPLCAVTFLHIMHQKVPAKPNQYLFGLLMKNVYKPIRYEWFSKKLRHLVKISGVGDTGHYTSHSLRRGGATALALAGVPLHNIQKIGDWKSLAVLLYLATPLEYRIMSEKLSAQKMVRV